MELNGQSDFWECSFLRDFEAEENKHKQLTSKNTSVLLKTLEQVFQKLNGLLNSVDCERRESSFKSTLTKLKREKEVTQSKIDLQEDLCAKEHQNCNLLSQQIDEMQNKIIALSQELELKKDEEVTVSQDIKNKQNEFKKKFNAVKLAKLEYKTLLDCRCSLLSTNENVDVFSFTFNNRVGPTTINTTPPNSIELLCENLSNRHIWKLVKTNPSVKNFNQLSEKLDKTQDVRGLLTYLRTSWLYL